MLLGMEHASSVSVCAVAGVRFAAKSKNKINYEFAWNLAHQYNDAWRTRAQKVSVGAGVCRAVCAAHQHIERRLCMSGSARLVRARVGSAHDRV